MPVALPPWSFTHIDTYDNCPHQYHWKYILKNKEPATEQMLEGRRVDEVLEKRVAAGIALPPQYLKYDPLCQSIVTMANSLNGEVRTQLKLGINRELKPCDFFARDVYGRGALDVTILAPPDKMFIGDWKTGKTREKQFQVKIFGFLSFINFSNVNKISACNIWLPTLKPGELYHYDRGDLSRIWSEIYIKLAAMELSAANDSWVKRQSPLCAWCPVLDCEHNKSEKRK